MIEAPLVLKNVSENREAFLEMRRRTIGASDVATILGLNKYETPLGLWMQKTRRKPQMEDNDILWYGREHEHLVAKLFGRRYGFEVCQINNTYHHRDFPWLTCTPDWAYTELGELKLLECKTPGFHERDSWSDTEAPDAAHAQLITQLAVTGLRIGRCVAIVAGNVRNFFAPEFEFNDKLWEQIFSVLEKFHQCMVNDTPPPARVGDMQNLDRFNPRHDGKEIVFLENNDELLSLMIAHEEAEIVRKILSEKEKACEDAIERIEVRVKEMMGTSSLGYFRGYTFKRSTVKRKAYEVKATEYETFKIKRPKNEENTEASQG